MHLQPASYRRPDPHSRCWPQSGAKHTQDLTCSTCLDRLQFAVGAFIAHLLLWGLMFLWSEIACTRAASRPHEHHHNHLHSAWSFKDQDPHPHSSVINAFRSTVCVSVRSTCIRAPLPTYLHIQAR